MQTGLLIGGRWVQSTEPLEVKNKYNQQTVGTVFVATREHCDAALAAAAKAAPAMAALPAHKRADILLNIAAKLRERREEIARTIAAEAGKALKWSRIEVDRSVMTFTLAAEEARRIHGETVPLDAVPSGEGYFGFWTRRPVGVVLAITPFNFPLNLVAHKVAPAIAAGNSLILKPAELTPLTSVLLFEILQECGLPEGGVNLLQGPGERIGPWLVSDPRVAKITFTGSAEVGRAIISQAGIKKVTLELGNTAPVIILPDADLDFVAKRCAFGAFYYSGQVCISVQRIYSDRGTAEQFTDKFVKAAEAMQVGDPLDERIDIGPMIQVKEAERIENWVGEAKSGGAKVLTGGKREGSVYWPTVLSNVKPDMKVIAKEAFAPVASLVTCDDFESALKQANATEYGLQASIFTRDINKVLTAIKRLDYGGIVINDIPTFRADHMPYGGNRQSGLGREGLRFAIEEMTNIQMIVMREG